MERSKGHNLLVSGTQKHPNCDAGKERQYFSEHRAELLSRHLGKVVLVKDEDLIGAFNTIEEALAEGARRFGLTPFLVREVTATEEKEINIPALTLGLLRADSSRPI